LLVALTLAQHDAAHRPTADALDTGQQLRLPCPAATALVAHLREDGADRHVGPREVHLADHLHLAAAIALDAQEPRRKRGERLIQRLGTGW
jgi:hypothetical protein